MKYRQRSGFTLIELSIVLVIIGLLVAAILTGQELIQAATIRSAISQIQQYNSAVNTFESKYSGLPGDLLAVKASGFGFAPRGYDTQGGDGDGNGHLEGCHITSYQYQTQGNYFSIHGLYGCEVGLFWQDLNKAGLIDFSSSFVDNGSTQNVTTSQMPAYFPASKLGFENYITVYNDFNHNFFIITHPVAIVNCYGNGAYGINSCVAPTPNTITPNQASAIDEKIDDGYPATGLVTETLGFVSGQYCWATLGAHDNCPASSLWPGNPDNCTNTSTTPYTYNLNGNGSTNPTPGCNLLLQFQ